MTPTSSRSAAGARKPKPWISFWCPGCKKVIQRQASKYASAHISFCATKGKAVVMRRHPGPAAKHPLYEAWSHMRRRCTWPHYKNWNNYGGRGIKICDRWRLDFWAFVDDMGPRPAGYSIDRIDNNGNYEPGNCRWATQAQQNRNTRFNKLTEKAVLEIRSTTGNASAERLAAKYNTTLRMIFNVRAGIGWKGIAP